VDPSKTTDEKLDEVIALLKSIDWKIWLYLKANKYITDEDNE
jgi:hypothetical protein